MYPDKFYNFSNGKEISNKVINQRLDEIKDYLNNKKEGEYCFINSGNTFAADFKYEYEYLFIVSNNHGYSELTINRHTEDINEISFIK